MSASIKSTSLLVKMPFLLLNKQRRFPRPSGEPQGNRLVAAITSRGEQLLQALLTSLGRWEDLAVFWRNTPERNHGLVGNFHIIGILGPFMGCLILGWWDYIPCTEKQEVVLYILRFMAKRPNQSLPSSRISEQENTFVCGRLTGFCRIGFRSRTKQSNLRIKYNKHDLDKSL